MKRMRINPLKRFVFLVVLSIGALFVVRDAVATTQEVTFDFDGAPYMGGAVEIEAYMEDIYGSDITVTGGIVGNGFFNGPLHDYPGDHYIQAGPGLGTYEFSFLFIDEPIISVSFDWAVRLNAFHAYADDDVEPFFSSPGGWDFWTSDSFEISFGSPVSTLRFTDSHIGEIEVDNLVVTTSVPEPATISLFGLGITALALLRKRTA